MNRLTSNHDSIFDDFFVIGNNFNNSLEDDYVLVEDFEGNDGNPLLVSLHSDDKIQQTVTKMEVLSAKDRIERRQKFEATLLSIIHSTKQNPNPKGRKLMNEKTIHELPAEKNLYLYRDVSTYPSKYEILPSGDKFAITKVLIGKGSQKKIKLAFSINNYILTVLATGPIFDKEQNDPSLHAENLEALDREIKIQTLFKDNPRFVQLLHAYPYESVSQKHPDYEKRAMMMEYCDAGDLRELLDPEELTRTQKQEKMFVSLFGEILKSIVDMHDHQVIHHDLKPENIFLQTDLQGQIHAKIGDFGSASQGSCTAFTGGTPEYMSPEIVQAIVTDNYSSINSKSDLWALGAIIFETLAKEPLLDNLAKNLSIPRGTSFTTCTTALIRSTQNDLFKACQIVTKSPFENKMQKFMQSILVKDIAQRPSPSDALRIYNEVFELNL